MEEKSHFGMKIREKRIEQGYNLKQMAEAIGKTPSFLSQVERGLAEPSITSLRKISETLGLPLFYFLFNEVETSPVVKKGERKALKTPGYKINYELLTPDLNRQMEILETTLGVGVSTVEDPIPHQGEECTIVIKGKMKIQLGEETYILEEGDSIYYFASIPHKITNIGDTELVIISALTPPGF